MKKRAFTLTELMVVISIIALLVMVVSPSLMKGWSVARRTVCQNNLAKLSTVLPKASGVNFTRPNNISQLTEYFPDWQMWPAQAFTAISDPAVFRCPEDDSPQTPDYSSVHKRVVFRSSYGGGVEITLATQLGDNYYYLGRTGFDPAKGKYSEYVFEEAGNILVWAVTPGYGDFWIPTNHNDGYLRIYNLTGELVVIACNCGGDNQLWIDNKPAFGPDTSNLNYTQLNRNVGKTVKIGNGTSTLASYGVNSYAHRYPYGSSVLVLMDYAGDGVTMSMSADPDEPAKVRAQLLKSLRHLDRLNILKADGSVQTVGLSSIDPAQNRPLWNPKNLVPHADD
jgi:prepilin-type N-terminal cleavage/methylation domain-containing protein/prepilin-type processing-associated H-X9-DG protein